jgi:hypothetical protein
MLGTLAKVAGLSGLVVGVFYLLYKQILAMSIFTKLSRRQTFFLISSMAFLVWALAVTAVLDIKIRDIAMIFGSNNVLMQNTSTNR